MYNEKIESLIAAALADGILTDKERQILIRRAVAEGIEIDNLLAELNSFFKPAFSRQGNLRSFCPNSVMTALQYINYVNNKPKDRIKYTLF